MALKNLNWDSVCEAIATLYGTDAQTIANTLNNRGIATGDVEGAFKMLEDTSYEIFYNKDGSVRSYNYVGQPDVFVQKSDVSSLVQDIDSNTKGE